ncbi:hypothetical protein [Duncaniella freteri]|uniref:hypothetical protein n=1 Tax=Duncaniella freteri TaxID=2530391 RepID=UPI0025875042|nr:hypothetical protein [Duncaniella freteri]
MISLPLRVACILIAGFFIVLVVTYIYKLNNRKVFWGVGLTTIISILILLGLGILRPSWGTEIGMAVIVGISTAIGCAITLIYAAEDLHQKKRIKVKKIAETESVQEDMVSDHLKVTLPSRLDTELSRKIFDKAIDEGYIIINDSHYEWTLNKVLLAYMCGRIYCEDYPKKTIYDEKMYWMPGRVELFPGAELDKLFNMKDLTQSRHSRKNKAAPIGSEKIDKLFE